MVSMSWPDVPGLIRSTLGRPGLAALNGVDGQHFFSHSCVKTWHDAPIGPKLKSVDAPRLGTMLVHPAEAD
jgi:hypothetical protein